MLPFKTDLDHESSASLTGMHGGISMYDQEKLGSKGCCCDMRRATMIISIFHMCLSAIVLVLLIAGESLRYSIGNDIEDEELLDIVEEAAGIQMIFISFGLISSICSLQGARKYNIWLVAVNIGWMIVCWIASVAIEISTINAIDATSYTGTEDYTFHWVGNFISALIVLFWIYPMAMFIREVRLGIMRHETYPREEYSCCCIRRRN
jgi:hypothetical protein